MLRGLVLLLLVANLAFYSWSQGWLTGVVGLDPQGDREPQRMKLQVAPEALKLVAPERSPASSAPARDGARVAEVASAPAAGAGVGEVCLEFGPFTSKVDVDRAEGVFRLRLPSQSWDLKPREVPGHWLVYLGPFQTRELMQRRAEDLRRIGILQFEEVQGIPQLEFGLALGHHSKLDAAESELHRLTRERVRGVRLVQLNPPGVNYVLHVPRADAALQAEMASLARDPAFNQQKLGACAVAR
jgi:hypothetical protein